MTRPAGASPPVAGSPGPRTVPSDLALPDLALPDLAFPVGGGVR